MPMFLDDKGRGYWAKKPVNEKHEEQPEPIEKKPISRGNTGRIGKKK